MRMDGELSNREFMLKDKNFLYWCERCGIPATARQASKFRNKKGKVYHFMKHAKKENPNAQV